ncbi:MAG: PqqD family protein [Candidatus Rokubacteria bacterium]|nr:PqqD family protein [Candidatus Rokubacteria bacterium]
MASRDSRPRRVTVPWRAIDTEALIVDPKAGLLYPLNSVAARVWELCDGDHTVDAIVRALVEEFDSDEATIRTDVLGFVDELSAAGLITMDRSSDATGRGGA